MWIKITYSLQDLFAGRGKVYPNVEIQQGYVCFHSKTTDNQASVSGKRTKKGDHSRLKLHSQTRRDFLLPGQSKILRVDILEAQSESLFSRKTSD